MSSQAYKLRIAGAMQRYHERQEPRPANPQRKNSRPEKLTEQQVLQWAKLHSIHLHIVDSTAYDFRLKKIGQQKATSGFSDLVGNTEDGLALYIELKALGKRHAVSEPQRRFLEKKINQNCFAAVVDSHEILNLIWHRFLDLKSPELRRQFLLDQMPQKRKSQDDSKSLGFDLD